MELNYLAIAAMILAQIADILTTQRFLRHGYVELNPVMSWAMRRFGWGWVMVKMGIAAGTIWLAVNFDAAWALWVVAVITAVVAVHNWRLVK